MSVSSNALAYGYSVTATAGFAMLSHTDGPISVLRIFCFVVGACLAFAGVNAVVTRGFRERVEREPPLVLALSTSLSLFSVSVAVALVALLGWALGGWAAWLLGALLGTWLYLSVTALEMALARTLHITVGSSEPKKG
jgi:hypothetical protein